MTDDTQKDANTMVSWLALALAAFASIVAVVAFNRSGTDLDTVVVRESQEAAQEVEETTREAADAVEDTIPDDVDVDVDVEEDVDDSDDTR